MNCRESEALLRQDWLTQYVQGHLWRFLEKEMWPNQYQKFGISSQPSLEPLVAEKVFRTQRRRAEKGLLP